MLHMRTHCTQKRWYPGTWEIRVQVPAPQKTSCLTLIAVFSLFLFPCSSFLPQKGSVKRKTLKTEALRYYGNGGHKTSKQHAGGAGVHLKE